MRTSIKFTRHNLAWTERFVKDNPKISRTKLSIILCEKNDWKSSTGKLKDVDCRKEMNRLEKEEGLKIFPPSRPAPNFRKKRDYSKINLSFPDVSCSLSELGGIEFIRVDNVELSTIWHYLMAKYHYLGEAYLYGQQVRYLIKSYDYGWLGGLSFSSSSWSLEYRDRIIDLTKEQRVKGLSQIACNSRFLILPTVKVKNLASYVLSNIVKNLLVDWEQHYGVRLQYLETFVDSSLYQGTCYKAAGWTYIGQTKGRGRNDVKRESKKTVKDVYLFPLSKGAQKILSKAKDKDYFNSKPTPKDWVEEEFARVNLGDKRLDARLMTGVRDFFNNPGADIPEICNGETAKLKGIYRLFDNEKVNMDKILKPHYDSTIKRIREKKEDVILAVQDTTELDYTTQPKKKGSGYLNSNKLGFILHDTMLFSESGIPWGLADIQLWARDEKDFGKKSKRAKLPIEQKESNKWLVSYNRSDQIQKMCPDTKIVSVGDRESDIYELYFEKHRLKGKAEILVRSEKTRSRRCDEGNIWEVLPSEPVYTHIKVDIPRSGSRKARTAKVSVRTKRVKLKPPHLKKDLPSLEVTCIYLKEEDYDASVVKNPLEWMLSTTVKVTDEKSLLQVVGWYSTRWGIESYHKTLKSGCNIEDRQFGDNNSTENCLAIDLIVAWKIACLTKLGREVPDIDCSVFFEECEWKALVCYHTEDIPPDKPPTLKESVLMVAKLGGFLGRKGDGMPGVKKMWKGLQKLDYIVEMWLIMSKLNGNKKEITLRCKDTYG